MRTLFSFLIFLGTCAPVFSYTWEVHCDHSLGHFRFGPWQMPVNTGDTLHFILDQGCAAKEVSEATYLALDTIWNGGAQTAAGGGYVVLTSPGHHYFVCPQHAGSHEALDVEVFDPAIVIATLAPQAICAGDSITIAYLHTGVYMWMNEFDIQISDSLGSFAMPTTLAIHPRSSFFGYYGQLGGIFHDTVSCAVRSSVPAGSGYLIRLVSRLHGVTGAAYPVPVTVFNRNPNRLAWTGAAGTNWDHVGNWDSPCAVPGTGDTVIIASGTAPPALVPAASLGALILDNAAGVRLGGDLRVTGNLTLQHGGIALGSNWLTIAAGATLTGGGPDGFIVCDSAGALRREDVGPSGGAFLFPVGPTPLLYTPISIENAGTPDAFDVRVIPEVRSGGLTGSVITDGVVSCTWLVEEDTPGGSLATVSVGWESSLEYPGFDRGDCFVAHHDGSAWGSLQPAGAAGGTGPYQRSVGGVTAFSPFAVGSTGSAIPVAYRLFTAELRGGAVFLTWETDHEISNYGFLVERRAETAAAWETLQIVPARGMSEGAAYSFVDIPPDDGAWWYRLRQFDIDGSASLSPERVVFFEGPRPVAEGIRPRIHEAWPNPLLPAHGREIRVTFQPAATGTAVLSLHDLLGRRIVILHERPAEAGVPVSVRCGLPQLPPGMYLLRLTSAGDVATRRLAIAG